MKREVCQKLFPGAVFLVLTLTAFAGPPRDRVEGFVVTHKGDTIRGGLKLWDVIIGRRIKVVSEQGSYRFQKKVLSEYYIGGKRPRLYMNLSYPNHRGKMIQRRFLTLQDGPVRLLEELATDHYDHVVLLDGKVYVIEERYFSDEVWFILTQCEAFRNKYVGYRKENLNKFFMNIPKQERIWREMIALYNAHCLTSGQ